MSAITQTTALFVDAYRDLNARKLFWLTLILSAVAIAGFGLFGVEPDGLTIFGAKWRVPYASFIYKFVFSTFLIGWWAKFGALILALISTASIFPELISSGSIDLYLSKPIGRLRLFLTKYATGLIFVVLQTAVFAAGSYLVFGWRGHEWRPSLFLIIPLVVLLYSYLFCVCVLIGVLTRSTIAAILLTVLFWFLCWGVNTTEQVLFSVKALESARAQASERQVQKEDAQLQYLAENPSRNLFGIPGSRARARRAEAEAAAADARREAQKWGKFHGFAYAVASVVPKTGETVALLDRKLFSDADLAALRDKEGGGPFGGAVPVEEFEPPSTYATTAPTTNPAEAAARAEEDRRDRELRRQAQEEAADEANRAARSRSVPWIIGTSLAFEAVILAWAAWVFCRRDY